MAGVPRRQLSESIPTEQAGTTATILNLDGTSYAENKAAPAVIRNYAWDIGASANDHVDQQERGNVMPTDQELTDAKIAASDARSDTKIARMEGKLDLMISKLDGLNVRFEDARNDAREARATAHSDNVATRANIWVAFVGLAAVIIAIVLLFPTFFDFGSKIRDRIADEVKTQLPIQKPSTQK